MFYKYTDTYSHLRVQFLLIGLSLRTLIQHHKFLYFWAKSSVIWLLYDCWLHWSSFGVCTLRFTEVVMTVSASRWGRYSWGPLLIGGGVVGWCCRMAEWPASVGWRFSDIGNWFSDIGKSSTFPDIGKSIPDIRKSFPDIGKSTISRYRKLISRYREIIPDIGKCWIKPKWLSIHLMYICRSWCIFGPEMVGFLIAVTELPGQDCGRYNLRDKWTDSYVDGGRDERSDRQTDRQTCMHPSWVSFTSRDYPDSKVHRANMGPIWGRQDPGGPHVPFYLCS